MSEKVADWADLGLQDMFYAYRKAKADCFYESSVRTTERFVHFEQDLAENLNSLLSEIQTGGASWILNANPGAAMVFPKSLIIPQQDQDQHAFFSDADREYRRLAAAKPKATFRVVGDFEVEIHIISALWVNLVGHKFDAKLSRHALGNRLRRYKRTSSSRKIGAYHLDGIGSFEPYYEPYRRWRDDGIKKIHQHLEGNGAIAALTLDFSNFYHRIDPTFLNNYDFHKSIGVTLSPFEQKFTDQMVDYLLAWSESSSSLLNKYGCKNNPFGGIPIGLSIVRIASNLVLHHIDREIESKLSPIYYARYVDDIFLVLQDDDKITSQNDLWRKISDILPEYFIIDEGEVRVKLPTYFGHTNLEFKSDKQKCFFLSGQPGLNLLANIASQIREVASERRLMPIPEQLDKTSAARALSAVSKTADEADSLRRADGLTLRRLGWSVLLRSVEVLSRDLDPPDWRAERENFYQFALDHVVRPNKILEQLDHLPRLLGLSIALGDWRDAWRFYESIQHSIDQLSAATSLSRVHVNGFEGSAGDDTVWVDLKATTDHWFRDAVLRSFPPVPPKTKPKGAIDLLGRLGLTWKAAANLALLIRQADLARTAYKDHLCESGSELKPYQDGEEVLRNLYSRNEDLAGFLRVSVKALEGHSVTRIADDQSAMAASSGDECYYPYLFPTRPYTAREIALYAPMQCVFADQPVAAKQWAAYVRAVRGIWVTDPLVDEYVHDTESDPTLMVSDQPPPEPPISSDPPEPIRIGRNIGSRAVTLGITSFGVDNTTWARGANGTPDHSKKRYRALANMVNEAIRQEHRPDYLLLPELSLPERWIRTISGRLMESGISLIAGVDYRTYSNGRIDSCALLVLSDDRLGFQSTVEIRQQKAEPAPSEEHDLFRDFGRTWNLGAPARKPIYCHEGFHFGVLVCSELQNLRYRQEYQGNVDCMMVLSWNKDLETFSALVDAAGLDVHAYIALVNNRVYGDSRVRRPAKKAHDRDICRVRGGLNDQLVVVKFDPSALRAQQSRSKRWPGDKDQYKPAPEGFVISKHREVIPG